MPEQQQAPGLAKVVEQVMAALERRAQIEVVPLIPKDTGSLLMWRARQLPAAVRKQKLFGIHSFTSAFPFFGPGRRVQTIHELPWRHGVRENAGTKHRTWARLGPLFADRVATGTEFVARELRSYSPLARNKISVCPWGVGEEFADEPPAGTIDEALLGHYRLPEDPLVLCLGAVRMKKNLAGVLRAVAEVKKRGGPRLHVVISGHETQNLRRDLGLAAKLGLSANISTLDTIEPEHLPGMYRLASVVPVLSHSEGFGLVTLEALASGTPVVVPKDSAQAEVAGEYAITVDPHDDLAVADGLMQAVKDREALRYTLAERAKSYSWDRSAQSIEDIWQAMAK
ncbi:MAG: glycosyltransferase involved in cell wall biosynthesis [Planctomycetota bacterium]|jgi:glycosyltransferase involved in cell wall biosynthesis